MGGGVRVAFTKFGGRPHWEFDGIRLGEDAFGVWVLLPQGNPVSRPGYSIDNPVDAVTLFPREAPAVPIFYRTQDAPPEVQLSIYVDITTPPIWAGDSVTMLDLDLDVAQHIDGRILVLDEDEFAENQISYGYPVDLIALARASRDEVQLALQTGAEPYRSVGWEWLHSAGRRELS